MYIQYCGHSIANRGKLPQIEVSTVQIMTMENVRFSAGQFEKMSCAGEVKVFDPALLTYQSLEPPDVTSHSRETS
jgi:hypothetical protein